jgi:hypothetical protein
MNASKLSLAPSRLALAVVLGLAAASPALADETAAEAAQRAIGGVRNAV